MGVIADEQREELLKKQERERRELDTKLEILAALPDSLADVDWFIHVHKLYDRVASVNARYNRYESLRKHPNPTLDTVVRFAEAFPQFEPMVILRDGFVGVRSKASADAIPEEKRQNTNTSSIAPFWVDIDPASHSQEAKFHWLTRINDKLVEAEVTFPIYGPEVRAFGTLDVCYERYRDGEISNVVRNNFTVNPKIEVLGNCRSRHVRYSSGSHKTPGHHLIYWENGSVDEPSVTVLDLVAALKELTSNAR